MVEIICDTEKEQQEVRKLMRMGEAVCVMTSTVMQKEIDAYNYRTAVWRLRGVSDAANSKK